jgi:hypothetical protein
MQKAAVIEHFGSPAKTAAALHLTIQSVHDWPAELPPLRQLHVERVTNDPASPYYAPGRFVAADDVFERISRRHSKPKRSRRGGKKKAS